jgi:chemotaxis protein histidine kinase CheA
MMDAVGYATSGTGGYMNSRAVTAGNQAYQEYLHGLNDVAMELRDDAYEAYVDEGNSLIEDIALLRSLDGEDYDRYLDAVERYYKDGEYLIEKLTSMSDAEFEQFLAETQAWESDREYAFDQQQAQQEQSNFEREQAFKEAEAERDREFKEAEAKRDQANKDREYELAREKAAQAASSSGRSSDSESNDEKNNDKSVSTPRNYDEFCAKTGYTGIMTETEYLSSPTAMDKYSTYQKYLNAMYKKYG